MSMVPANYAETLVTNQKKKFCGVDDTKAKLHMGLCGQGYKTFYTCNLRVGQISWGVYPWQPFPAKCNICRQSQESTL